MVLRRKGSEELPFQFFRLEKKGSVKINASQTEGRMTLGIIRLLKCI